MPPTAVLVCLYCAAGSSILYLCIRFAGAGLCQTVAAAFFSDGGTAGGAELSFDPQRAVPSLRLGCRHCRFIFVSFRLLFGADAWDHQGQILLDRGVRKAGVGGDFFLSDGERCGRCVLYPAAKYLEFCLIRGFIFGSSNNFVAALWYTFHKRSAFCRRKVKKTAWLLEISRCIIYNFLERVDQKRRRYGIGFYTQRAL